jgi:hypothetical protein
VNQLVESHPGADGERHDLADALRALDQKLRDLLAGLDPRVDRGVLFLDPRHAMTGVKFDPLAIDEV